VGVPGLTALALGALAVVLLGVTALTARRPAGPVPDRAEFFRRWAPLHGGYDPAGTALTGRWLALVHTAARPLAARGVAPHALTGWALLAGAGVPAAVAAGGRWPLLAVALLVAAGLLDGLDGAVAVLTGRATRFGYVLDSVADRVGDAAYVAALWWLGGPGWLCAIAAGLVWLPEYARARAGNAGMRELAVLTVAERPTRIAVTAVALAGCGGWPDRAAPLATAAAAVLAGLGAVALAQLLVVARRRLSGWADQAGDDLGGQGDQR